MKKHILTIIAIITFGTAYTQINPIREQFYRSSTKIDINKNKIIKVVPTDFKEILWSTSSNNWDTTLSYAYQLKYVDNKIINRYDINYTGTDTSFKYEYIYDSNDKLIQVNKLFYNSNDSTYNTYKRELYSYFNNDLKTVIVYQEYDSNTQTWITQQRKIEELDYKRNLILSRLEEYSANSWKVLSYFGKGYTYYNNTKKLVLEIDSVYSTITKKTFANNKTERAYNNKGEMVEYKGYSYNNNTLNLSTIINIEYNNQGIPVREIIYDASQFPILTPRYKTDSLTWLNFNGDIDYFDNVQLTSNDSSYQNSSYYLYGKTIGSKLDSNNSYTLAYYWAVNNILEKFSRIDKLFDRNKNLIESIYYGVDANKNWDISNADKNIISYDTDDNISEYIEQRHNQNHYVNYRKSEFSNYINIEDALGFKTSKNTLEAKLYPNPSNNGTVFVNVNLEAASVLNIKITDLKGSVVYTDESNVGMGLNTIELNGLQQGLYIVVLTTEYGVARQKLAVK